MAAGATAALRPYPAYKQSGVAWLPAIPETWSMQRNGRLFAQRNETGRPELPVLEVSLRTGVSVRHFNAGDRKQAMEDRAKYKVALAGDLAYNMMRMWQGAVGIAPVDGLVSPAYVVARAFDPTAVPYFDLVFHTPAYMREVENWSRGIVPDRNRLYWEAFKQIQTPVPPPDEQSTIIRFIEHLNRQIRRYIGAKRKLIALLNEQKQAIIHQALTLGLEANVKAKPSRFDWLAEVPESWRVTTLSRLIERIDQGWSPVAAEGDVRPDQWAVLTLSAVRRGTFDPASIKPIPLDAMVPESLQIRDGDLLVTRSNTRSRVGDACIVKAPRDRTILSDLIYRIRTRPEALLPDFLLLQLLSRNGRYQIERDARGSSETMPKISQGHIARWTVVVPSITEQRQIVAAVAMRTGPIEVAATAATQQIEMILQYRDRTISEIVTGKLDVRDAAAHLTEQVEDATAVISPPDDTTDEVTEARAEEDALS